MLVRMWSKGDSHTVLVETGTTAIKNSMKISQEIKNRLTI